MSLPDRFGIEVVEHPEGWLPAGSVLAEFPWRGLLRAPRKDKGTPYPKECK